MRNSEGYSVSEYDTALAVCTEFASRHIEVSGGPSLCDAIDAGGPTITGFQLGRELTEAELATTTERKIAADAWCIGYEGAPITDTITIVGKEWAQPDLFNNLSWNNINAFCPAGVCIPGGVLNGHDMTGWMWASEDDIHALFNYFIGRPVFGPEGARYYQETGPTWALEFWGQGSVHTLDLVPTLVCRGG